MPKLPIERAEAPGPHGGAPSPPSAAAPPEDVHRSPGASSADEAEGLCLSTDSVPGPKTLRLCHRLPSSYRIFSLL